MKKNISILCAGAAAVCAYGQDDGRVTTQFNTAGSCFENGEWFQTDKWTNGTPDAEKHVIFAGDWARILGSTPFEAYSIKTLKNINTASLTQEQEQAAKDGTLDPSTYVGITYKIGMGGVIGAMYTDEGYSGGAYMSFGSVGQRFGAEQVMIAGDITFNDMQRCIFGWNPGRTYSETYWALDVGGIVNMNGREGRNTPLFIVNKSGNESTQSKYTASPFIRINGLQGKGFVSHNDPGAVSSTIFFQAQEGKTFQGGDWTGMMSKFWVSTASEMNLVMDGGANGGRQYLRMSTGFETNHAAFDTLTLEVRSGHMGIYNTTNSTFTNITLNGGILEVAYAKAGMHNPSEDEMGQINVGSLEIAKDSQIWFDVSDNPNDSEHYENDMVYADSVSGSGKLTLVVELDADYFTDGQDINESLQLFSITNENSYDWALAVIKVMYNGADISDNLSKLVRFDGTAAGGSVWVDISGVVPEPAAVAVVIGVFALAFAAFRRRK